MSNFPTAEEVCETLELMALFADEDDSTWRHCWIYRFTHCRAAAKRCKNPHEDWVKEFRKAQHYIRNANKAPRDPTKIHDVENPFLKRVPEK